MFNVEGIGERLSRGLGWVRILLIIILVVSSLIAPYNHNILSKDVVVNTDKGFSSGFFIFILVYVIIIAFIFWVLYGWMIEWVNLSEKYINGQNFDNIRIEKISTTLKKWMTFAQWSGVWQVYSELSNIISKPSIFSIFLGIVLIIGWVLIFIIYRYVYQITQIIDVHIVSSELPDIAIFNRVNSFKKVQWSIKCFQIISLPLVLVSFIKYGFLPNAIMGVFAAIVSIIVLQMFEVFIKVLLERIEQNAGSSVALPLG